MKKFIAIMLLALSGCGISEDCVTGSGKRVMREVSVTAFDKIFVYPGVAMEISQAEEFSVTIEAGENFIGDVSATVKDGVLSLREDSGCNWVRRHGDVLIRVTAPTLTEIYSNTDRDIRSGNTLTFDILRLYAMDNFGGVGTGDFYLSIDNSLLYVAANNIAAFYISGESDEMSLNFYNDMCRFEGPDFHVKNIDVFHRSSNDMIVHPLERLSGNLYSTGNLIAKNHPAVVEVEEHYTGRVIFE